MELVWGMRDCVRSPDSAMDSIGSGFFPSQVTPQNDHVGDGAGPVSWKIRRGRLRRTLKRIWGRLRRRLPSLWRLRRMCDYYQKVLFFRPNYNGFKHL